MNGPRKERLNPTHAGGLAHRGRGGSRLGTSDRRGVQASGGPREGSVRGAASSRDGAGTGAGSPTTRNTGGSENVTVTTPVEPSRSRQALQCVSIAQPSSEGTNEASAMTPVRPSQARTIAARSLRKRIPAHDSIPTGGRRPLRRSRRAVWRGPGENRPMHIPDGFLSAGVAASSWAAGAGCLAWALRAERSEPEGTRAGTLGALAAFPFAAELVNVRLLPGASGHLVG